MTTKRALALLVAVAALACSPSSFELASQVDTLRVLAVRADKPFAEPGETVHLDALVADPKGAGRAVVFAWGACVNPGGGEVIDCAARVPSFSEGDATRDVAVPGDILDDRPPDAPVGLVGVIFAACGGALKLVPTATAPVTCVDPNGAVLGRDDFMWGQKRILAIRGQRNANPAIAEVHLDGAPWNDADTPLVDSSDHALAIVPAPGSAESYGDGLVEDLVAFFFVSAGGVGDEFAREPFSTSIHGDTSSAAATLWIVLRDDRGGVDWAVRRYRLQ